MYVWFTNTNVYFSYCDSQKQSIKYVFSFSNSVFFSKTRVELSGWGGTDNKKGEKPGFPPLCLTRNDCLQPFHK